MQGTLPLGADVDRNSIRYSAQLEAGVQWRLHYVNAIGEYAAEAGAIYEALICDVEGELARAKADWNTELNALFTSRNDRYSGCLPVLVT